MSAANGIRHAAARRIVTSLVRQGRDGAPGSRVVLLRVECPFCLAEHVHAGGTVDTPIMGVRQAKCYGRPGEGLRYLPQTGGA